MIALITPTGARIDQFKICAKWMQRQDYTGEVLWIIVDDGAAITTNVVQPDFRENWQIVKVYPKPAWSGTNTQGRNLEAGIVALTANEHYNKITGIFIIEDDDYYKSFYLSQMVMRFGVHSLIGETNTIYYNVVWRQYADNCNRQHSSLFQTAFTPGVIPLFLKCLNNKWIDAELWKQCTNKYLFHAGTLSLGIKGMPGRGGIGCGHTKSYGFLQDPSFIAFKQLIGETDAAEYERYYGNHGMSQHRGLNAKRF